MIDANSEENPLDKGMTCRCITGYTLMNGVCTPEGSALLLNPTSGLVTSELDSAPSAFFNVALNRAPTSPVTFQIVSSNTNEGTPVPAYVSFDARTWATPQTIGIQGMPDAVNDGDVPYSVSVGWPSTKDGTFKNQKPVSVSVTNKNVAFPVIYKLDTSIITSTGGAINITGDNFTPQTTALVLVGAKSTADIQVEVIFGSSKRITLGISGTFVTGNYLTIRVTNPDGSSSSCPQSESLTSFGFPSCPYENQLYVTSGCPEGTYGDGIKCQPCPSNGVCPGGSRIWPTPGYWAPNEQSKPVGCFPSESCLGSRGAKCMDGYDENFCSVCKEKFYRQGVVCRPCEDPNFDLKAIFGVSAIFAGVLSLSVILMPSSYLFTFTIVILGLQQIIQIGLAGSDFIPLSRKVYTSLLWFLLDFNFVRPGCNAPVYSYPKFYFLTLMVIAFSAGVLIVCALVRTLLLMCFSKIRNRSLSYYISKFKERSSEGLTMLAYLVYILVATRTVRLFDCKRVYESQVMRYEMARECYSGSHLEAVIVGWIIFVVYVIGYPVYSFYILKYRRFNDVTNTLSKTMAKAADFLMDDIQPVFYWFRALDLGLSCIVCVVSIAVHNIPVRLMGNGMLVLVKYTAIILYWPMTTNIGNMFSLGITLVKCIQSILLLSVYNSASDIAFFGTLIGLLSILIIASYFLWKRRAPPSVARQESNMALELVDMKVPHSPNYL